MSAIPSLTDKLFTAEGWIFLFLNCLSLLLARSYFSAKERKEKSEVALERRAKYKRVIGGWKARIVYARFHGNAVAFAMSDNIG